MSECVIKVGDKYYADNSCGTEDFTCDVDKAKRYKMLYCSTVARDIAAELGGIPVPVPSEHELARMHGGALNSGDEWLSENLVFILNCVGDTPRFLIEFMDRYRGFLSRYSVADVLGLPCALHVQALPTTGCGTPFKFCFVLSIDGDLTPKQQEVWKALPYGIPITTSTRLLVESLDGIDFGSFEHDVLSKTVSYRLCDYPERQGVRERCPVSHEDLPVSSTSSASNSHVHKMKLQ